jgi:diguanylate cyclase (GGDEF)-like protein/PAS domain S-box-containing protein
VVARAEGHRSLGVQAIADFTREWVSAIARTSYLARGVQDASVRLTPLVAQLADALHGTPFDDAAARRIGVELARSGFRGPNLLQTTLKLIRARAEHVFEVHHSADLADELSGGPDRVSEVLAEIAAGYADGLCERSQLEQEALLSAVLEARDNAESALRFSEERFRTIFTEAGAGIAIAGVDGRVIDVNPAVHRMFGSDELHKPHSFTDHMHPEDIAAVVPRFRAMIDGSGPMNVEVRFIRLDGTVAATYLTASLVRDADGNPDYVISVIEDITERNQLRTKLHEQTYHDQLTRLPNRSLMEEQLSWAFSDGSSVERVGLCHLDLDGFRMLNDTLGHQVGDQLLLAVSGRLQLIAGGHLVTRAGADEFTVLVPDPESEEDLVALAERLLDGLAPPVVIGQQPLHVSASLGLAWSPVAETTPGELQRSADTARSWAKAAGGGRWALFDPQRDAHESLRFSLATSVPTAVDRGEFRLHYQPLVRMSTGDLVGAEALVRWRHPEHGLLSPSEFIELAERNGSIVQLGRWVLTEACRQARTWVDELGPAAPYVSVNVSPRQLAEPGWLDEVSGVLASTGLDPGRLQLEITERAVVDDETAASNTLTTLREMGVRLALDDFGTGYSSLAYLQRLPVHGLKIDGSFIRGLREASTPPGPRNKEDKIIEVLITMAHALDLVVTAEWVETPAQARRLAALGCDVGQGNWYGDPVAAAQLTTALRNPLAG